jgi:pyridoxine 5-phosphate synthase
LTKLSVNINKVATLRNARGGNIPDVLKFAIDCEKFGAQGITVHPRPDERHIRYSDLKPLKQVVTTELNIEGYPSAEFIKLVLEIKPHQVTLVPDPPDALTSNAGWDTQKNEIFLRDVILPLKNAELEHLFLLIPNQ